MTVPDKSNPPTLPVSLFQARDAVESLTRNYVLQLLQSQEAAQEHAHFLMAILNSVGDGLVVWDRDLNIVLANQAAADIAGEQQIDLMSREQFYQKYSFYVDEGKTPIEPEQEPIRIAFRERRAAEAVGLVKGEGLPESGIWLRVKAAPILDLDGQLLGGVTLFHDISEIVTLLRQRDALVAVLAHDLKNHLAAEDATLDLLVTLLSDRLRSDELELLSDLKESNSLYLDLSHTLLEIYRTEICARKAALEDVQFERVVASAVSLNKLNAAQKGVNIECKVEANLPPLRGVFSAWRQVLHNLIQNAVAASSRGQTVEVSASRQRELLCITVKDQAGGISQESIRTLFEPVKPADQFPKSTASTGFGLYLVRFLIEAQGAGITCTSSPQEGTTFLVECPLRSP